MDVLESFRLGGKVAVVTGASRGIGRSCAAALAEAGASIVMTARDPDALGLAAEDLEMSGAESVAIAGDIDEPLHRQALIDTAEARFGTIDVLVNNVGGGGLGGVRELDADGLDAALHFNVTTAYDLTRRALRPLEEGDGGSVVMISSRAASSVAVGRIGYATAKAALSHLTRLLAAELAPRVRVNAVEPGPVETESLAAVRDTPRIRRILEDETPMGRPADPDEIAAAVLYLASPAAAFTTGTVLRVDGGRQ
jgi:7-alpha-hydroxysteroid dehydrogenase